MLRPWNDCKIVECGEALASIPKEIICLEPHPYVALGAPYGDFESPWRLRKSVIKKLLKVQEELEKENFNLRLGVFDAWRPLSVQLFMINHAIKEECLKRGVIPHNDNDEYKGVLDEVSTFWAPPSSNLLNPPPHSTGGAIDLTLVSFNGKQLDMGGQIDEIGSRSYPDYYEEISLKNKHSSEYLWNSRRKLLNEKMTKFGFIQHPNEWWHFSYGDQLWAWKTNSDNAIYGRFIPLESNSFTC